jgi:hypothetical protein
LLQETILLEVTTFNRGLEEVGGSAWKHVLGQEAAAARAEQDQLQGVG